MRRGCSRISREAMLNAICYLDKHAGTQKVASLSLVEN
jgi:hypothetical protein